MARMNGVLLVVLGLVAFGPALVAEEESPFDDDLFAESEAAADEADARDAPVDLAAGTLGVRLSGDIAFEMEGALRWRDLDLESIGEPTDTALSPTLHAQLALDARPAEDFRVLAKVLLTHPFVEASTWGATDIIRIREVFADWDWGDLAFFRAGKHSIHWGTGYFFSPADVLNLTPIDPEDPEAEREGPLSLRAHIPLGVSGIWAYLIAQDVEEWNEVAGAAKAEFLIGNTELGIGAFYRYGLAPRLITTATFPLWRTSWFAEAVTSIGSDRRYVVEGEDGTLGVVTDTDGLHVQATGGFRVGLTSIFPAAENIALTAQYLFDDTGYEDASILRSAGIPALIAAGDLLPADLLNTGRHYAAARLTWTDMFQSDIGLSASWMSNLGDMSGRVQLGLSFEVFERITARLDCSVSYGNLGDELTPQGSDTILRLTVEAGNGRF